MCARSASSSGATATSQGPTLYGTHVEEVRSHHSAEPEAPPPAPEGGPPEWDARMDELGGRHETAVLTLVGPDGFPFSLRLPIGTEQAKHRVHLGELPDWLPATPSKACLTAHAHGPDFNWQTNFQVRGDLVQEGDDWSLVPHRLVGGFELPESQLADLPRELPQDAPVPQEGEDGAAPRGALGGQKK